MHRSNPARPAVHQPNRVWAPIRPVVASAAPERRIIPDDRRTHHGGQAGRQAGAPSPERRGRRGGETAHRHRNLKSESLVHPSMQIGLSGPLVRHPGYGLYRFRDGGGPTWRTGGWMDSIGSTRRDGRPGGLDELPSRTYTPDVYTPRRVNPKPRAGARRLGVSPTERRCIGELDY